MLSGLPLRLVQIACVVLLALKLAQWSFAGVFMDEAYYWMWGQHPALSYYDHPPLNAWLLGLSSALFGWNLFALRLPVALAFFADILALYLIARRIGGDWRGHFWVTLLLFLTTPVFSMVTNYALPDHTLLTALLFAIYFFLRFFGDRAAGGAGESRDLMLGAMFLGLAALSKYNAAFLALGIALFVIFYDRALLRQARLYLAAALSLVIQTPVIIWNSTERFASYGFILDGRHAGLKASTDGLYILLFNFVLFVGPILLWPMIRFVTSRTIIVRGFGFARGTFILSSALIVGLSLVTLTLFHWNLPAYAALLPFLALYMRPAWLLVPQAIWGTVFAAAVFVSYAPISYPLDVWRFRDQSTAWSHDWSKAVAAIEEAKIAYEPGFIAAADYTTAAALGFALKDPNVTALTYRRDQYDYWFDPQAHVGEDALIYGDKFRPIPASIRRSFESITEIASKRVGGPIANRQRIYLGKGYKPQ